MGLPSDGLVMTKTPRPKRLIVELNAMLVEYDTGDASGQPVREVACRFHGQTAYFAAALAELSAHSRFGAASSVSKDALLTIQRFFRVGSLRAGRSFATWTKDYNKKAAGKRPLGMIICEGPAQSGPYRWARDLPVSVSPHVAAAMKRRAEQASKAPIPRYVLPELRVFLTEMNVATRMFYAAQFAPAAEGFLKIRRKVFHQQGSRFRAHAGMFAFRCLRRDGNESAAKDVLEGVELEIRKIKPPDPILKARAAYNRAWRDLSEVDEARQLRSFETASAHLSAAAPDDARWGYLLGIQGRLALRRFVMSHAHRRDATAMAEEAIDCFAHSAYLLCRAEDHWGMQEACWNVADALFRISQVIEPVDWRDETELGLPEIEAWISLSDDVVEKFETGFDSIRNSALRGRIELNGGKPNKALTILTASLSKTKFANANERGRVCQLLVDAHLMNGDVTSAVAVYEAAKRFWKNNATTLKELDKLYKYSKADGTVSWRAGAPTHLH